MADGASALVKHQVTMLMRNITDNVIAANVAYTSTNCRDFVFNYAEVLYRFDVALLFSLKGFARNFA